MLIRIVLDRKVAENLLVVDKLRLEFLSFIRFRLAALDAAVFAYVR